jgi:Mitochondrial carrier protein
LNLYLIRLFRHCSLFSTVVSQAGRAASDQAYKGIVDCAVRVFREEGAIAFYRGLPPRLVSVVPMIGIQFGVYEFMKRVMIQRQIVNNEAKSIREATQRIPNIEVNSNQATGAFDKEAVLEEAMMGVAASQMHPNPVPRFSKTSMDSAPKQN